MILFFCFSTHVMSTVDNLPGLSLFLEICLCLLHNINVYFTTLVFVFRKGQFNLLVYFSPCSCKRFHILTLEQCKCESCLEKVIFIKIYLDFIRQFLLAHFGFYNLKQIGRIPANATKCLNSKYNSQFLSVSSCICHLYQLIKYKKYFALWLFFAY